MTQYEIIMARDALMHFSFFSPPVSLFHCCLQPCNNVIRILIQVLCYRDDVLTCTFNFVRMAYYSFNHFQNLIENLISHTNFLNYDYL